jgi:hypothetical protein
MHRVFDRVALAEEFGDGCHIELDTRLPVSLERLCDPFACPNWHCALRYNEAV